MHFQFLSRVLAVLVLPIHRAVPHQLSIPFSGARMAIICSLIGLGVLELSIPFSGARPGPARAGVSGATCNFQSLSRVPVLPILRARAEALS